MSSFMSACAGGDSERHIMSVISHSCGGRGPDGTLRDLCRGSYIFCTSDPNHMDRATSTVYPPLLLSVPIRAIFSSLFPETAHILWLRGQFLAAGEHGLCIYLIFGCSVPVMHSTAARRALKKVCTVFFFFFLIGPQE